MDRTVSWKLFLGDIHFMEIAPSNFLRGTFSIDRSIPWKLFLGNIHSMEIGHSRIVFACHGL
jgi:hypothetical protein